ncbi:MAG TPA: sigma-70 family RNA polymerase sigma factor [Polyangiaceae bacterium]|jgi:RNA polymerase sigma-70 factor (ECF subfamily)|nr:sigma-70 family RNA polymerase sigma factor [Polyangiaceae bacterium]
MSFLWPSYDDRLRELCARARAGDRDAFRALYAELYGPVAKFVARRIGRREDAEDLVAKIFHKLLERLPEIDQARGSVRMFVLSMARNAVIDHVRTRRGAVPIEDVLLVDEAGTPLDALLREEDLRDLRAVLLELPDDTREMLALRYGDGLRHGEIAELYGINVAAVKQRFSRALRALRERLRGAREEIEGGAASLRGEAGAAGEGDESSSKGSVANVRV